VEEEGEEEMAEEGGARADSDDDEAGQLQLDQQPAAAITTRSGRPVKAPIKS
jgi:hypothetical protein